MGSGKPTPKRNVIAPLPALWNERTRSGSTMPHENLSHCSAFVRFSETIVKNHNEARVALGAAISNFLDVNNDTAKLWGQGCGAGRKKGGGTSGGGMRAGRKEEEEAAGGRVRRARGRHG